MIVCQGVAKTFKFVLKSQTLPVLLLKLLKKICFSSIKPAKDLCPTSILHMNEEVFWNWKPSGFPIVCKFGIYYNKNKRQKCIVNRQTKEIGHLVTSNNTDEFICSKRSRVKHELI